LSRGTSIGRAGIAPGLLALAIACQPPPARSIAPPSADGGVSPTLAPLFVTAPRAACTFAGPMAVASRGQSQVLLATADGTFAAVDPRTGAIVWEATLAPLAGSGLAPNLVAPPVVAGHRLVFAWQEVMPDWTRTAHHLGVLDLDARALDPQFPPVTLAARAAAADGAAPIDFLPAHAFSRAALVQANVPDRVLGLVYAGFGNVRDLQPWHGWLFEVDLDAWQARGAAAAVTASLVTTAATADCGPENGDGARQMVCGGGIWSPSGPAVIPDPDSPDGFALLVPTGNGLLDPTRGSFANAVLRVGRGLAFDAGCDPGLCAGFDPTAPGDACASSCQRLFIPRVPPGQLAPVGPSGQCTDATLLACYAKFDWDLGASSPVVVDLPAGRALLQPGKDGALYLVDTDHLGTLHDRAPLMPDCGQDGATCNATWAGTIVTRPALATVDGDTLALIPTFISDDRHPAGLQAVGVATTGAGPVLQPRWRAPPADDPASVAGFRSAPGGVTVVDVGGEPLAALVDPSVSPALLYWVRVRDGAVLQRLPLAGGGQRYAAPLAQDGVLYVPSCARSGSPTFDEGPSVLEAFSIAVR
jgi:hypothetical protein